MLAGTFYHFYLLAYYIERIFFLLSWGYGVAPIWILWERQPNCFTLVPNCEPSEGKVGVILGYSGDESGQVFLFFENFMES